MMLLHSLEIPYCLTRLHDWICKVWAWEGFATCFVGIGRACAIAVSEPCVPCQGNGSIYEFCLLRLDLASFLVTPYIISHKTT